MWIMSTVVTERVSLLKKYKVDTGDYPKIEADWSKLKEISEEPVSIIVAPVKFTRYLCIDSVGAEVSVL